MSSLIAASAGLRQSVDHFDVQRRNRVALRVADSEVHFSFIPAPGLAATSEIIGDLFESFAHNVDVGQGFASQAMTLTRIAQPIQIIIVVKIADTAMRRKLAIGSNITFLPGQEHI